MKDLLDTAAVYYARAVCGVKAAVEEGAYALARLYLLYFVYQMMRDKPRKHEDHEDDE